MFYKTTVSLILVSLSLPTLAGDVVPMGENQYSISKTAVGCGFAGTGGIKTKAYKEISAFCAKQSLLPEVSAIQEQDGAIGRRCARVTLEFRCVTSAGSVITAPSGRPPDRDMNHSPDIAADRGQFGHRGSHTSTQQVTVRQQGDKYDQLAKLKDLLDTGAITTEEYETEKRKILAQ